MTLSLFGFVTCLQNHISLSDECDTPLSTSECFWLRLNRQSFYHYRKRQLVPTDRYRFRSIGKLIGSVSHDRVAYRYLDAFPNQNKDLQNFKQYTDKKVSLRATAKILGARASEHSFKFCKQLKIFMDHLSPLTEPDPGPGRRKLHLLRKFSKLVISPPCKLNYLSYRKCFVKTVKQSM